jgi:hypothetical protein
MKTLKFVVEENVSVETWFKDNKYSAHKIPDLPDTFAIVKVEEVKVEEKI